MKPITTIEELEALRNGDTIDTDGRSIQITGDLVFDEVTHIHTRGGSINTDDGDIYTDGGAIFTDGGSIQTAGGAIFTDGGVINTDDGDIRTHGGHIATSGGDISTSGGSINTDGGFINTDGGDVHTHGGDIRTNGGSINTDGGVTHTYGGSIVTHGGGIDDNIPPPIEDQIKLLDEIRARVLAHPECLNMNQWHCGSSHCLVGHAQVIKDGVETDSAYDAGVKYIPLALPMFFMGNDTVIRWLENREYAKSAD